MGAYKKTIVLFFSLLLSGSIYSEYKVYALKYGQSDFLARLIDADKYKGNKRLPISWLFYLLANEKEKKYILIDAGFAKAKWARHFSLSKVFHPAHLTSSLNIRPEEITDLFITHSHFDHIEGAYYFSRATIFLTRRAYQSALKQRSKRLRQFLKRKAKEGHIKFTRHGENYLKHLYTYHSAAHTPGAQIIELRSLGKSYLFVGDECYRAKVCRQGKNGSLYSRKNFAKMQGWLKKEKGQSVILTAHELAAGVRLTQPGVYLLN